MIAKPLKIGGAILVAAFAGMQFVQPGFTNPPSDPAASLEVVTKPPADMINAVNRACKDCHSNQTRWPWYSRVSPISWLVYNDVKQGRLSLNFSQWRLYSDEMSKIRLGDACEAARSGSMPLWQYTLLHPEAKLSQADVAALCATSIAQR